MSLSAARQISATVSARKARLKLDDDSDSDSESTRQKHVAPVARRTAAASSKPPAGAKGVPQLPLGRVSATDSAVESSSRSTQPSARSALSTRSARASASTFATPRHDATAADMRRAMVFNDDSDDDDNADRIIRAASQRLQLGSSVNSARRTPRGRKGQDTLGATLNVSTISMAPVTPAPAAAVALTAENNAPLENGDLDRCTENGDTGIAIVAHSTPALAEFQSFGNNYTKAGLSSHTAAKAQQSRLEKVIGHVSDDEDSPMAPKIFRKKAPEPEPEPEVESPNHVHEHHFEEHKLKVDDTFKSHHEAIDKLHHEIFLLQREMRHQQLYNRQIVKTLEDTKRTMGEEIQELKSEVRVLKSKLADDEASIPARIKQAERAAVPWDRYRNSRAPSPTRRTGGMLGR